MRNLNTYKDYFVPSERSESATVVGAGVTVSPEVAGVMPASEIFRLVLSTFKIRDWTLFVN